MDDEFFNPIPRMAKGANALVRRLDGLANLSSNDHAALVDLTTQARRLEARQEIVGKDASSGGLAVMLSGFGCRYKLFPDGRRQVLSYLAPGDFVDLDRGRLSRLGHSIGAVGSALVSFPGREPLTKLLEAHPEVAEAMLKAHWIEDAIAREWIVNLGLRTAYERTAALLCEFYLRLEAVGLADNRGCDFPFTQGDLAEMLGLSAVHINRTLQDLRRNGLIALSGRRLSILDLRALAEAGIFDAAYLRAR